MESINIQVNQVLPDSANQTWEARICFEPAKGLLRADEDIGDILVLTEQGNVEKNLQGLAVSRQNNKLSLSTVQGLGRLVGTLKIAMKWTFRFYYSSSLMIWFLWYLAELLVVGGLLHQVEDLGGQSLTKIDVTSLSNSWLENTCSARG